MAIAAKYEVLDQIGAGGMAVVHRARQRGIAGFDRVVAVKQIQPHLVGRSEFVERFVREARIVSALAHANIVQIYDFGGDYIAMEYLEGWSLLRIIAAAFGAGQHVPLPVILTVLHQLCDALDHVHNRRGHDGTPLGIVHRDLSLGNLFITRSGHLKLIDFGIATAPGLAPDDGRICGKPSYMAPEVIRGRASDGRADVFAVGVIAWELLTARRPFVGDDDDATMKAVLRTRVGSPLEHRPDCPPMLGSLVLAALAKDPAKRSRSAATVRDQLEVVMRVCEVDARASVVTRWLAESGLLRELAAEHGSQQPTLADRPRTVAPIGPIASIASILEPAAPVVKPRYATTVPQRVPKLVEVRRPTPVAWQLESAKVPTLRSGIAWKHLIAIAAAIVIAPIVVLARGGDKATPAPAAVMTVTPIAGEAPAPLVERPVVVAREVVATVTRPRAHLAHLRAREEAVAPPRPTPKHEAPGSTEGSAGSAEITTPHVAPPRIEVAPPPPIVVPAPPPVARGPITIPPDRVRWISGEIGRVDRKRLERDGGVPRLSAVLCIDATGAVSSVKLLADEPSWLATVLDRDLRTFRFTPYPHGAACFVRQVSITR